MPALIPADEAARLTLGGIAGGRVRDPFPETLHQRDAAVAYAALSGYFAAVRRFTGT